MVRSPNRRKRLRTQNSYQTIIREISQRSRRLTQSITQLPVARQSLIPQYSYRHDLGHCNTICQFCNAFHWIQERSYKSTIDNPLFFSCCQHGQMILPSFPDAPEPLRSLLRDQTESTYSCIVWLTIRGKFISI